MLRVSFVLIMVAIAAGISSAQDTQDKDPSRMLSRYDANRPSDRELAMYRLDWAPSLEEALNRAAREQRPIFLVIIHAQYGDIASGHC